MKHLREILPLLFAFVAILGHAQETKTTETSNKTKKVVFIILDGIAADMLAKAETPNLDSIAKEGAFSEAYVGGEKGGYSETPTISAVGYNSLLTGVWVNKHNVFGNDIKDPNYHYPTIFRLFKDEYPDRKTAIFSTWEDNRTKLLGENLPQTQNLKMDFAFDGFELDTLRFPHDAKREYIKNIDALVATKAASYIKENAPDLSWVYLEFSDDMGHGYGDSPQLYNAIHFEDSLVGKIHEAVKLRERDFNEDWLILITTDHGRTAEDGKGHGGQTDRERSTWIVTNSKQTNSYFKQETPAIVDLLPTMTSFLNINVPENVKKEWDGISLIDPVDAMDLKAKITDQKLTISWKIIGKNNPKIEFFGSKTNAFKTGEKDIYTKIGTAKLKDGKLTMPLKNGENYSKIVLKTPKMTLNTWITP